MVLNFIILQWLVFGLLFWVIALTVLLIINSLYYRKFTKSISKKDLKTLLGQIIGQADLTQKEIRELQQELGKINLELKTHLKHIGFIRFNPFSQTGGDQSFSLALLDERKNGLVLSSLHSRDSTRLYAKTIKNGQSEGYELSKEELKAIQAAK